MGPNYTTYITGTRVTLRPIAAVRHEADLLTLNTDTTTAVLQPM